MFRRILAGFLATALAAPSALFADGCEACEEEACPRYSLRLEAMGLKRSTPEDRVFATQEDAGGGSPSATVLDATDFGQDFEYGGRLALGLRMSHKMSFELAAYGVIPSEQDKNRQGADDLDTPFAVNGNTDDLALPVGFQAGSDFQQDDLISVGFDSRTWSVETNMWNELCEPHSTICARVGGGLRFIELDEDLDYLVEDDFGGGDPTSSFRVDNKLTNRLGGLQVGGSVWMQPTHSLSIGVEAKVGAFANFMDRDSSLTRGDGLIGVDEEGSSVGFATVFEVSVETRWDITPNIGVVAGYRFVQVNGAALATENLQTNLSDTGEYQDIRDDGSLYWHGPFVGAEIRF